MSRPCINCVRRLTNLPQYSGYRINTVYYTEGDSVTKVRLNHLASQPKQHIPRFQTYNGVSESNGQWHANPKFDGKSHHLGYFPTSRDASDAVREFMEHRYSINLCNHDNNDHSNNSHHSHDDEEDIANPEGDDEA